MQPEELDRVPRTLPDSEGCLRGGPGARIVGSDPRTARAAREMLTLAYVGNSAVVGLVVGLPAIGQGATSLPGALLGILTMGSAVLAIAGCYGLWTCQVWGSAMVVTPCAAQITLGVILVIANGFSAGALAVAVAAAWASVGVIRHLSSRELRSCLRIAMTRIEAPEVESPLTYSAESDGSRPSGGLAAASPQDRRTPAP
jgi:hypothetical protein